MSARIRPLTDETVGKIAAGEVVERPASVVKELIENALDAGSRRIHIEIRDGGSELIEVADDGYGISIDELPLAVQRHATSKLESFEDLDRLATLGFRGEALPSVGAVAVLTIRSREAGAAVGSQIAVTFGKIGTPDVAASAPGTTIGVRDLFANVPARRKFLRQSATEAGYITRIAGSYATAYAGVAFSLVTDGRRIFSTDGSGNEIGAAVSVIGPELAGSAVRLEPLDTAAAVPGVRVDGWISVPAVTRSRRQGMVFFVNGRLIQNRALTFALEEAYHSLLTVGRHPMAMIHVRLDPATVDVNVHPTKAEVKFADERAVCRAVQRAAHAALTSAMPSPLPELTLGPLQATQFPLTGSSSWHPHNGESERLPDNPTSGAKGANGDASSVPILRVLGQVAATYIIAEGPDGMYLIDQHAAHERVMYEKILGQISANMIDRQPLLDALVVDLAPEELSIFERSRGELAQIGFDIEPFGDSAVVVRGVPAVVGSVDIAERLRLILGELASGADGESWLDAVAISSACHTSIRAGQSLSLAEMRELIYELERSAQPRACGHGRPTMLHLTQTELERQFGRR